MSQQLKAWAALSFYIACLKLFIPCIFMGEATFYWLDFFPLEHVVGMICG